MYKFLNYIIASVFFFLFSCSQQKDSSNKLPRPGQERKHQIYYIYSADEKDLPIIFHGESPDPTWEMRFEKKNVSEIVEIERVLREWSARPYDLIILGSKKALNAWVALKLPMTSKSKVFAIVREKNSSIETLQYVVPDTFYLGLRETLCKKNQSIQCVSNLSFLEEAPFKEEKRKVFVYFPDYSELMPSEGHLRFKIKWAEVIQDVLKGQSLKSLELNLASGYWDIFEAPSWTQIKKDNTSLNKSFEDWKLSELTKGLKN